MTDQTTGASLRLDRRIVRRLRGTARRLRDRAPLSRPTGPTVSIILPIYNVEEYLAACLDSIAAQTFDDYEVVVVDDGSPDGSRAIAERYAATDPRLRIVFRPNGGLGAARNTGVREARGRFLTFLDSDDLLPPNALQVLVGSAQASGSDIVVGAVRRFDQNRSWRPEWVSDVHLQRRVAVTISDFPPLLRNLYTCDKLFRLDFWKAQQLWFREGVAYEDQPLVTQLYTRARAVDVLTEVVYEYRARDDQSSISQQTSSLKDLRDRIAAWRASRDVFVREVAPAMYESWLQTLFDAHFHWYLNSPGTVDDTYWSELQTAVADLTEGAPPAVWAATAPDRRVLIELTRQNRRADVEEFVRVRGRSPERWGSTVTDEGIVLQLPLLGDPDLDDALFLIRPEQIRVAHSVESFSWLEDGPGDDGTFEITGWAFLAKVDLSRHESSVSVVLRNARTGAESVHPSTGAVDPVYLPPLEDDHCDYRPGTFRAQVTLGGDVAEPGDTWDVLLRVTAAGFTVTEPVTALVRSGSAGVIPALTLAGGDSLVAEWRFNEPLGFRLVAASALVEDVRLQGRTLTGSISGERRGPVANVTLSCGTHRVDASVERTGSGARFRVEVPLSSTTSLEKPVRWSVDAKTATGESHRLTMVGVLPSTEPAVEPSRSRVLAVQRTSNGFLALAEWLTRAVADELRVSDQGVLEVAGTVLGPDVESVVLVTTNKKARAAGAPAAVAGGRFEARLPLRYDAFRFGSHPLPFGDHDVRLRVRTTTGDTVTVPLRMSVAMSSRLPVAVQGGKCEGRVIRGPEGGVRISLVRPIGQARGRFQQHRLQTDLALPGTLTRGVLMRSYFGEHATDNGLSIQRELERRGSDLPVFWAVQDLSVPVAPGGIPVVVHSREWYELLFSVAYYVDNMYQPEYHRKPPGQVMVQTFHGYPFKTMGHPHWRNLQLSQARIEAYDQSARQWDFLVSPARYATPLLTRDFAYPGTVLEIGYPRNDVLQSGRAEEIRALTRRSLGIADGQTAVLYAPTFRDYLARQDTQAKMADFFDFAAATEALGEGVVLLVRGHAFNARSRHRVAASRQVVDVTDYPEVSDLYLAADAAIVDYSSLRFDFGVTGKPMIFHVPDLQRYRDTRGWLFDFEPSAPGPLVDTTEEVVALLQDLDGVRERYAEQYAAFRASFLDLEDGQAGRRFVDAVFAPRGDA